MPKDNLWEALLLSHLKEAPLYLTTTTPYAHLHTRGDILSVQMNVFWGDIFTGR